MVRLSDGREVTVSTRHLSPIGKTETLQQNINDPKSAATLAPEMDITCQPTSISSSKENLNQNALGLDLIGGCSWKSNYLS